MSHSETKQKNLPKREEKDKSTARDLVEYSNKIQKSSVDNQITECTIIDTEFMKTSSSWYNIVSITIEYPNSTQENYFPISKTGGYIDDNLELLYNYLNKNPNSIDENMLVGETLPAMYYDNNWNAFIPTNFTKSNTLMNTLLYSKMSSPSKTIPYINKYYNLLYILGGLLFITSISSISTILLIISLLYTISVFVIQNYGINGVKI